MYQYRSLAVPDFMTREAPPNYIAGLGRGATGFTTRSDLGGGPDDGSALLAAQQAAKGNGPKMVDDDDRYEDPENESSLFSKTPYADDDVEADRIYEHVEKNMMDRRKTWKEIKEREDMEKYRKERPSLQQQFAELKRGLSEVTNDEWAGIPEVQDMVRKRGSKKVREDVYERAGYAPDSLLLSTAAQNQFNSSLDAAQQDLSIATKTDFVQFGQARDKLLGIKLDQVSDSVSGQTTVDPKGYLTSLASVELKSDAEISDIKKARTLLRSVINTNPKHAPGWIAAARLEEVAGRMAVARDTISKGCDACPKSEDVWIEAARLNNPENAKIILANAIKHIPQSVKIWLKAKDLETDVNAQKRVLRKALEHIPNSIQLWKAAISAEEDSDDARIMLSRAVECVPFAVELWLALARLDNNLKNAQAILNKALKTNPTSYEIWIAAAKLQEQHRLDEKVHAIVANAVKKLASVGVHLERDQWVQEAEICEKEGFLVVCDAIIRATIGMNLEEEDKKITWFEIADRCTQNGSIETARCVLSFAISEFPDKKSIWRRASFFEKQHGSKEQLTSLLERAVKQCPKNEILWLMWAKEEWTGGDVSKAKSILEKAFESNRDSEQIWLAAIKIEMETREYSRARELLNQARDVVHSPKVWMKSAVLERILKNYDNALIILDQGIKKFPQFEKLLLIKGQVLEQDLKRIDDAREHYKESVKKIPKSVLLWIFASRLEQANNAVIKARAILERARILNPQNADLWLETVQLERKSENISMAKALLSKALQECPSSGLLWCEMIQLENRPQRKARSMDALKKCENDPYVVKTIARMFWQERKIDKARNWFTRACQTNPDLGDLWAWLYKFESDHGTKEQQEQVLKQFLEADPKHGVLWPKYRKSLENIGKSNDQVFFLLTAQMQNII